MRLPLVLTVLALASPVVAGEPLRNAGVTAEPYEGGAVVATARTDANGEVRLGPVAPGAYKIRLKPPAVRGNDPHTGVRSGQVYDSAIVAEVMVRGTGPRMIVLILEQPE